MLTIRSIAFGVVVVSYAVGCMAQTIAPPFATCYVCSPCTSTRGLPLYQCQLNQRYCYTEIRDDGAITRSCAVNCTEGTWEINHITYSVYCCNNKAGCNSAIPFPPSISKSTQSTLSSTSSTSSLSPSTTSSSPTTTSAPLSTTSSTHSVPTSAPSRSGSPSSHSSSLFDKAASLLFAIAISDALRRIYE